ncbi:MAG TPA: TonB-dependent receptor, partial [Sphingomonadaceae bacterium]|nr:TonB-dependent receptor [Sphingomonadaceae bacterium]
LGLNFLDARLEIDGFPPPDYLLGDTDEFQDTSRISGFAGFDIFVDDLRINGTWSLSETRRENYDPSIGADPVYATAGREQRAGLRGFWRLTGEFHAHFGGERVWNEFSTLFDAQRRGSSAGAYAQVGLSTGAFALNAGARIDDHEGFGSEWSLGADAVLALGYGWRLRAALGEGFKAPSLFQRYSEYGNEALQPERSRSFDIGLERGDRNDDWHFAFSAFRRESEELIGFVSCFAGSTGICADRPFGTFDNVGLARAQGIELEAAFRPSDWLRLQGAWSYVEASDRTRESANQGNDLARRPRHALTLSADWDSQLAGLNLGADLRIVSSSFDDAANLVPLAGYRVGTIRASIPLTGEVELFGRVENIWDERYQTAAGYGTPGRSAYIGARAQW